MAKPCPLCGRLIEDELGTCPFCGLSRHQTPTCPSCGNRVRKTDDFCWTCGARQERQLHCWYCGSDVFVNSSFCTGCGYPQPDMRDLLQRASGIDSGQLQFPDRRRQVAAEGPPPARAPARTNAGRALHADRLKIVTVLFADFSGFTQMSERLDPEEVKDIMNECFEGLTETITAHGGIVDKYMGDCVMALFGARTAQEDDAERAVEAALTMQSYLREFSSTLEQRTGLSLSMRIGINTGKVLAGYVGHGERRDFTVMGDAVNLASRLESICPLDSVLISNDTYRLVKHLFRCRPIEPVRVKGKREAVRAVEVLGQRPGDVQLVDPSFRDVPTRMIGRGSEMSRLRKAFATVRDECRPMTVTVRSPLGMGKSRLLHEFASWLADQGATAIDFMRCRAIQTRSTFAPLAGLLMRLVGAQRDDQPGGRQDRIREYLETLDIEEPARERVEAAVAHLLGAGTREIALLAPFSDDPEQLQNVVMEGILTLYRARTSRGPVALLVDDLHAATLPVMNLLSTLVSLEDVPLMLVAAYRPDVDQEVERRFGVPEERVHLSLEPLSAEEADDMVRDLLQRLEPLPTQLVRRVVDASRGRPLFIQEILADLIERKVIRCEDERWELDLEGIREIKLPQSVEAAILSRLDAMPLGHREALQIAAVVGDSCWEGLVAELGIAEAPHVLDELAERQFIRFNRTGRIPGEREFQYLLSSVREVIEHNVLRKVKARLHGPIAEWIHNHAPREDEDFVRLLAHHYHLAKDDRAIPMRMRAGLQAEQRGDVERAIEDLQWVWQNAHSRTGELQVEPGTLAKSRVSVARLLRRAGRHQEAEKSFRETMDVMSQLAEERPVVDLCLMEMGIEVIRSLTQSGEQSKALDLTNELTTRLSGSGPAITRLKGALLKRRAFLRFVEQDYPEAIALYRKGIDLLEPHGPSTDLASLYDGLGVCLFTTRNANEAEESLQKALSIEVELGNREGEAAAEGNLGALRYTQGKYDAALRHYRKAQQINETIGNRVVAAVCRVNAGECLLRQDNLLDSRRELEKSLHVFRQMNNHSNVVQSLKLLVECLGKLGDEEARLLAKEELARISNDTAR